MFVFSLDVSKHLYLVFHIIFVDDNEFTRGVHFTRRLQQKPDESPSLRSLKASCSHRKARLDLERSNNSSLSQQIKNLSTKCREREHELNENLLKDQAVQVT